MAKTRVDIKHIHYLQEEIAKINRLDLDDIDFYEDGKKVEIHEKAIKDFKFMGLTNINFITAEIYKTKGFEDN